MTIEELTKKLAIADDKKKDAEKILREFLDGDYITKSRFNEINEEKKTLQATVTDRDKQLETLKNSKGDIEALKAKIKEQQESNQKQKADSDEKLKDLRLTTAIQLAINNSAQDTDIVSSLFDRSKLILGEDGKVTGLDEQLKALKESKPFLFKPEDKKNPKYKPNGGTGSDASNNPFAKDTYNLTKQGQMLRENPEIAKAMAAEAGVTLP